MVSAGRLWADLVKLALVEKGFGSIALDVLWEDIPFKALLCLFPPDAVDSTTVNGKEERDKIRRPLFDADWTQFDLYAPRIKTIHRTCVDSGDYVHFDNILHFLTSCRPRLILFPNLLCLEWRDANLHEMTCLSIFFGSFLYSFKASTPTNLMNPRAIVNVECAFEVPLRYLGTSGQRLRKVEVPVPSSPITSRYHTPWITILNRCTSLVDVSLVPSPTLLELLSILPNLRFLTLIVKHWEHPKDLEVSTINLDNIDRIFPTLETLVLKEADFLSDITAILTGANCFARHKISIHCYCGPSSEEVAAFFKVGLHPIISSELRIFDLHALERSYFDLSLTFEFDVLRPLLHCHHMEQFVFNTTLPLSLSDDDVYHIPSAWPNISKMSFGKRRGDFSRANKPPVSIRGLEHLTACTRLLSLEFTVDVTEDDINSYTWTGLSDCPLEELDVCTSQIHRRSIAATACFLLQRFPRLRVIRSNESNEDRATWGEVLDTMGTIQALMKHHQFEIPRVVGCHP